MIGIFQRLFAEKKAEDDRIQDEYHSLLFNLASGHEVDVDDVRRLTIDSNRTEEQCSRDLETMQQRIAKVQEKQDWLKVQDGIPALQKKYDALRDELNAVIARIQPQLIKLEWDLYAAADPKVIWIDDFLSRTCLNKSLLEREQVVGSHRKDLAKKKQPLVDDLVKAEQHLSYFHSRLGKKGLSERERKEIESSQDEWQSTVEQLEIAIRNIDEQLEPLNDEITDIGREKLLP